MSASIREGMGGGEGPDLKNGATEKPTEKTERARPPVRNASLFFVPFVSSGSPFLRSGTSSPQPPPNLNLPIMEISE
jgi:hypothetical protein